MDIILISIISFELVAYFVWIVFSRKGLDKKRDLISALMFLLALVLLYRVFQLNLDFGLVLSIATVLAGFSWILAKMVNVKDLQSESKSYFFILLVITSIRSFAYEPYQIPSKSMEPGLQVGDFVLVNKYAYGLKAPGTNYLITEFNSPKRNDVAVFVPPHTLCKSTPKEARPDITNLNFDDSQIFVKRFLSLQKNRCTTLGIKYVKRVLGVPGDKVQMKGYEVWINGKKLKHELISKNSNERLIKENLDNKIHMIRSTGLTEYAEFEWTIPEGSFLAIGDNRDNSLDSRAWGYFSDKYLIGRAEYIWMHWESFSDFPSLGRNQKIN
jgi:signal peptidase I